MRRRLPQHMPHQLDHLLDVQQLLQCHATLDQLVHPGQRLHPCFDGLDQLRPQQHLPYFHQTVGLLASAYRLAQRA